MKSSIKSGQSSAHSPAPLCAPLARPAGRVEPTQHLPAIVVARQEDVPAAVEMLSKFRELGLHVQLYQTDGVERVRLIALGIRGSVYVFDLLQLGGVPAPLRDLLQQGAPKVSYGPVAAFAVLSRWHGVSVSPFRDAAVVPALAADSPEYRSLDAWYEKNSAAWPHEASGWDWRSDALDDDRVRFLAGRVEAILSLRNYAEITAAIMTITPKSSPELPLATGAAQ